MEAAACEEVELAASMEAREVASVVVVAAAQVVKRHPRLLLIQHHQLHVQVLLVIVN